MREPRYPLPRVVLDFTLQHCFRTNTVSGYAYDPTKTEVLAKDERITTESAGTVRNRPTESDVSSFSGRSVSRTANHPRRRDPNTSPDHSIGRSDGRGVLKATSADPWSASFMVETRTLFVFHKSKNFTSDYEIRMPPTRRRHDRPVKARSVSPTEETSRPVLTEGGPGDPSQVHTDVRVCPSAHTGRPWPSVSTHRTSGCPSVHISARSVDCSGDFGPRGLSVQYTQDVRQHTQDVRGCPCVSVCPSVHTGRPSAHAGRPSAHAGRPWLSVCLRVSVSAHRTSVSTHRTSVSTRRTSVSTRRTSVAVRVSVSAHRTSVSTHRTSVSTRRTSVAVRVCPCVRQHTQDVRQHTQDVRQHTQDIRAYPLAHTDCPWTDPCTELISAC
ncbi:hypothetical protein YC2023_003293 [Brassica napus]